jgi:hypothetical protein
MIASRLRTRRGQAMTEVVLLFPVFMFFLFAFAKVFAMLILVQKIEIASYYAARRWQLESHRNVDFEGDDTGALTTDITQKVSSYIGYDNPNIKGFLGLDGPGALFACNRTQVWNVCTLTVRTKPVEVGWMWKSKGFTFEVTKYVPNRDRPIAFVLPGLQP